MSNNDKSGCLYTPFVYDERHANSGRVSSCFFNTACGLKYVGIPFGGKCKKCDRDAMRKTT